MIQRIQTIWLLLASIVLFGLFVFPYVNFIDLVGLGKRILVTGTFSSVNNESVRKTTTVLLALVSGFVALLPFVAIFLYKNRKNQIKVVGLIIVLIVLLGVWMFSNAASQLAGISQSIQASNIGVGFFLLPVAIILLAMAIGAIRKDEKLIKSADRLR
ncbi:MAG: DUF4293 domain-containing protein [Sphingobacterium sp.]